MQNLIENLLDKLSTRVTYLDLLRSKIGLDRISLNIGWCGPYPPAKNGGAAVVAWFVKEMIKQKVNVFAIPCNNVCNKALLKGLRFARLKDKNLDVIFFYCARHIFKKYRKNISAKTVLYQTFHGDVFADDKAMIEDMAMADMVVAPTQWAYRYFRNQGVNNTVYIPHAVETSIFKPMKKISDRFEVIFVGRLCFYKGVKQFLLSIPFVLKACPDAIFRIHGILDDTDLAYPYLDGENKSIYTEVRTILKEILSKYSKNIKWHNEWLNFDDATSIYKNADILLFPTNNEGFGMPMVEAMACGIPCIVADKPPMNEIVINNETGFCLALSHEEEHKFRFPKPQDIADKIIYLKNNPQVYQRMSNNARKRAIDEYALSKNTASLINLAVGLKDAV